MAEPPPADAHETTAPPPAGGLGRTLLVGGGVGVVVLMAIIAALVLSDRGQSSQAIPVVTGSPEGAPGFGLTDAVDTLPAATLEGFAGGPEVAVADLLGDVPLVLNFWATWCPPCVAEMPDLQALHEAGDGAFRMVGVNTRDAALNAEPFIEDLGITYAQVVDRDGSYFTATGSFGMPTTLFVHPDGSVAYRQTGPLTLSQMQDLLAQHLDVVVTVDAG